MFISLSVTGVCSISGIFSSGSSVVIFVTLLLSDIPLNYSIISIYCFCCSSTITVFLIFCYGHLFLFLMIYFSRIFIIVRLSISYWDRLFVFSIFVLILFSFLGSQNNVCLTYFLMVLSLLLQCLLLL